MLFEKFGVRGAALMLTPGLVTFLGPLLVIKEAPTTGEAAKTAPPDVPLWQSIKKTLSNRTFLIYMSSVATFYFGLQFFLGGIAFMGADMLGISDKQLGLMNAAAFAPVPIMLVVFNLLSRAKGAKYAFRISLLVFGLAMLVFPLGWTKLNLPIPPIVVGIIAGVIASFSIGAFFTIPYAFPAHIAAVDAQETGKDRAGCSLRAGCHQPVLSARWQAPSWRCCWAGSTAWWQLVGCGGDDGDCLLPVCPLSAGQTGSEAVRRFP
jgi:Na+/melibiose symporter-like transporter